MPVLEPAELHASLGDPALAATRFLNEIAKRHPRAVSFAPGAPYLAHPSADELARYVERWLAHVRDTRGATAEQAARLLYEYGPSRGLICDVVADALHRDLGIANLPQAVVVTVGAQEAMLLVLRALHRDRRDVLAVTHPGYVGVLGAARVLDLATAPVPDCGGGPDLNRLREACRLARASGSRIRSLYVAPDHANPSGSRMSLADRHTLLALAEQEDFLVIEDGTYAFTAAPQDPLPPLKALDRATRVVHIGTFAKVCLPGARVGYVVADQPVRAPGGARLLADEIASLKGAVTLNTPPLSQAVVAGMLLAHEGSLAALSRTSAARYRAGLRELLDALDEHVGSQEHLRRRARWNRPDGGFFVRMRLSVPADEALLEHSATRHRVLWTPMSAFAAGPADDLSHEIRLSCSYLTPAQIDEGVRRLAGFIAELPEPRGPLPRPGARGPAPAPRPAAGQPPIHTQ